MPFDVKCHKLAVDFLEDTGIDEGSELVPELAQKIQDAIEDFFSYKEIDR